MTRAAAIGYVACWVAGLAITPAAPGTDATDTEVRAFFVGHSGSALLQAILVHGLAAVALLGVVHALVRRADGGRPDEGRPRARPRSRWLLHLGRSAVLVSLAQLVVEAFLAARAGVLDAGPAASTYSLVGTLDSVKLTLLGGTVAVAVLAAGLPRWLRVSGVVLAPLLPVSGLAFVTGITALYPLLYLSLPLLLAWVCGAGISCARGLGKPVALQGV